jgi:TatD DNase family protein
MDVHTHFRRVETGLDFCRNGFHQLDPEAIRKIPYGLSIGLHPWQAEKDQPALRTRFSSCLKERNVLALGECGLDRMQGASWKNQLQAWKWQFELAQETETPLIIHCVKAWADFLPYLKMSQVPMLFHGFSGKPSVADMLLPFEQAWFSIGPRFFRQADWEVKLRHLDLSRLTLESDTETKPNFPEMVEAIALVRNENPKMTEILLYENGLRFFGTKGRMFF